MQVIKGERKYDGSEGRFTAGGRLFIRFELEFRGGADEVLAFHAASRGRTEAELLADVIGSVLKNDLFDVILD